MAYQDPDAAIAALTRLVEQLRSEIVTTRTTLAALVMRIGGALDTLERDQVVGFIAHGDDPYTPRISGYVVIVWEGTVAPVNFEDGDVWINVSGTAAEDDNSALLLLV